MSFPASPAAAREPSRRTPSDWIWIAFLIWTAIGFAVLPLDIGEHQLRSWMGSGPLLRFSVGFLRESDGVWMLLAACCVYLHTVAAEGLATARRWAAIILVASAVFEWIGVSTGVPFGAYQYTDHFGWRLGGVLPAAIPFAWLVILICARYLVLAFLPYANRLKLAVGVGIVAVLTDLNLEFVAWKVRGYWIWYPGQEAGHPTWPPWQNYASWFVLSFALSVVLSPNYALRSSGSNRPRATRPILILALMNLLFAFAQLFYWWGLGPPAK